MFAMIACARRMGAAVVLLAVLLAGADALCAEALRDPWLRPFASNSIWNMPIGSEAAYVPANLAPAQNIGLDLEILVRVPEGAPQRPLIAPKSWQSRAGGTQQVGSLPLQDELVVPDAEKWHTPNNCAAFLLPDGRTVRHVGVLCRPQAGGPVYGYPFNPDSDLHGDGIHGSHGGSGLSALGGSIRLGELTSADPIRHALKVDMFCKKYAYYSVGRPGFRWPATRADAYAAKGYAGTNQALVMGSLLAIPPGVSQASLDLKTPIGRKLYIALQDYGAYVVDDSAWDCHYFCAEQGVDAEIKKTCGKFDKASADLLHDVNALFVALQVVDNNAPDRIGGGGTPRAPLAGPLAEAPAPPPALSAAPTSKPVASVGDLPKLVNGDMTEGADKPTHWTDSWTAAGKIEIFRDEKTFKSGPAALGVKSVGGPARGQAQQIIDGKPGQKFHVAGSVRAEGTKGTAALLGVQSYTADWKGIDFVPIGNAVAGLDWQSVGGDVTLPPKTARFAVLVMLEGDGTAWLDDVSITAPTGQAAGVAHDNGPKVEAPPKAPNSVTPAERFYPDYPSAWRAMFAGQLERAKKGDIDVVFLGDSLTQGWGDQKELWKENYEPLKAVNFGIGGDGTPQILWRIKNGLLDGYQAKLVVLMIGINNTWPGYSAEDTAEGIKTCITAIREKQPKAKVLVLGVLPIFDKDDGIRKRIKTINEIVEKACDGQTVRFLDMGASYTNSDGSRIAELYGPDRLHLMPKGYEIWARLMTPVVREMLK